ncbi:copper resistance protein CopC [Peribacillus sp. SCS-26]|uniref:copper resistance CopC family protein n=1 Tax=Paraperibacillus marinus TaxID=3115295 RepID=UPI0039068699
MKKLIILGLMLILSFPAAAFAHTGLESSVPAKGETVKNELTEIRLDFETPIEKLSTMKLFKDQTEIGLGEVKAAGSKLSGALKQPLQNGNYRVEWKIVGEDGHTIEGEYDFVMAGPETEVPANEDNEKEQQGKAEDKPEKGKEESVKENEKTEDASSDTGATLIMVLLGVAIIAGFLFLFRKKK